MSPSLNERAKRFTKIMSERKKWIRINKSLIWYDLGDSSLRSRTDEEHKRVFESCEIRRNCNLIYDGKLFFCNRTFTHNEMNLIPIQKGDFVDLRIKENLKERIKSFYSQDMLTTCRYCNGTLDCPEIPAGIQL